MKIKSHYEGKLNIGIFSSKSMVSLVEGVNDLFGMTHLSHLRCKHI